MSALKYSAATLALLFASSMAYAQDSTTVLPQPGTATTIECPAPGTVAEADLTVECKSKAGKSTAEVPKTENDAVTTGTTEVPKTDADAAATSSNTTEVAPSGTAQATVNPATAVLASQFMGQTVYSAGNESVGEINDLVMSKDLDNIVAIIGVGGFLGIGEKDVAFPIGDITATKDASNNLHLTISATKEELEKAAAFDRTAMQ
jgi:hypothetical protein